MRKKSLAEFRNNKAVYRFPRVAWFFNHVSVYVCLFVLGLGGVVVPSLYAGVASFHQALAEPVKESPYQNVKTQMSPALTWAANMVKFVPPGLSNWKVETSHRPDNIVPRSLCTFHEPTSTSSIGTFKAGNGTVTAFVSVYGAGMAADDFNARIEDLQRCTGSSDFRPDSPGSPFVWDKGFVLTLGDAIIAVTSSDPALVPTLMTTYEQQARATLVSSGCKAVDVPVTDATRNLYANKEEYTGIRQTDTLDNTVDVSGMPIFNSETIAELNDQHIDKPEAPLPANFPDKMPAAVSKPVLPTKVDLKEKFSADAVFQIVDDIGPGCGWSWSALKEPQYDLNALEQAKVKARQEAQTQSNTEASTYVKAFKDYAFESALQAPAIRQWNTYVAQFNAVQSQWSWLNTQREAIKPQYLEYVAAHDEWLTFDKRKNDALTTYENDLKDCRDKQEAVLDWERKYGNPDTDMLSPGVRPTPKPKDEKVPERPQGCTVIPARPAIIDMERGSEPTFTVDPNVTIPQSWPKPKTHP